MQAFAAEQEVCHNYRTHPFFYLYFPTIIVKSYSFLMTLPFPTNTLIFSLLCPGIFFSLPTQEFFLGQGKIKVGIGTETMTPNDALH